jgi:hypothetical protein
MWHVCGQFYPNTYITVPYSVIEASIAVSQILAAPAAAALLQLSGLAGLQGWQILFLAEGLLTLAVAAALRWRLPASISTAPFLSEEDKGWLVGQLSGRHTAAAAETADAAVVGVGRGAGNGQVQQQQCKQQQHVVQLGWQDHDDAVLLVGSSSSSSKDAGRDSTWKSIDLGSRADSSSNSKQLLHSSSDNAVELHRCDSRAAGTSSSSSSSSSGEPVLSSWEQVAATFRNRLILYLMLLKALKVRHVHTAASSTSLAVRQY